jgi:hypothetical protein
MLRRARLGAALVISLSLAPGIIAAADYDPCATFFWTAKYNPTISRYLPHYIRGEGLEDYGLQIIYGTRIRDMWSLQAHDCILSSNSYGYFANSAYTTLTYLGQLQSTLAFVTQLSVPSANPTYQARLTDAKASTYTYIIDPRQGAHQSYAAVLRDLVNRYDAVQNDLDFMLDSAMPEDIRGMILAEFCSTENRAVLERLEAECDEYLDERCDLMDFYNAIQNCSDLPDFTAVIPELIAFNGSFVTERQMVTQYRGDVVSTWQQIMAAR